MLPLGSVPASGGPDLANSTPTGAGASSKPDTPPVIHINGDNPAIIRVGAGYTDLGATITGPQADLDPRHHHLRQWHASESGADRHHPNHYRHYRLRRRRPIRHHIDNNPHRHHRTFGASLSNTNCRDLQFSIIKPGAPPPATQLELALGPTALHSLHDFAIETPANPFEQFPIVQPQHRLA
jgi:hypothetical protein